LFGSESLSDCLSPFNINAPKAIIMRKFLLFGVFFSSVLLTGQAQLTAPGVTLIQTTAYTNGATNDPIFIFCPQAGSPPPALTATPVGGTPGWNFAWFTYNPGNNSWTPLTVQNNQPTSAINPATSGGYRVVITDANGNSAGCFRAWVWIKQTTVDIIQAPAGCSPITLQGSITTNDAFTYYNPPPEPFLLGPGSTMTVCFTAPHSYVSDLAFYLVGPTSCGSPTVLLSPNPGANGQGAVCNANNNVNNLCFTTVPSANFNPCNASGVNFFNPNGNTNQTSNYTGTFSSYGPSGNPTPINWNPVYGCDATLGGWRVQIYDCIGEDVGSLSNANITLSGTSFCGPSTITYNSGNISSAINDNSCTPQTASIWTVPIPGATSVPGLVSTTSYAWTANPPVAFTNPNGGNVVVSQNLNPQQDTWFYLTATNSLGCITVDSMFYDFIPPVPPVIANVSQNICANGLPVQLSADLAGGAWSGPGIINTQTGLFNPQITGAGTFNVFYTTPPPCGGSDTITLTVSPKPTPNFTFQDSVCSFTTILNPGSSTVATPSFIGGYAWDINGDLQPDLTGINPTQSVTFPGQGTYPVTLLVTTNNTCFDTITKWVTVLANPSANFSVSPLLNCGEPFVFNSAASTPSGSLSFAWDFTSDGTAEQNTNNTSVSHAYPNSGTYQVTMVATGLGNCRDTVSQSVTIYPKPDVSYTGPTQVCGTVVDLSAQGQVGNPSAMAGYEWFFNGVSAGTGQNLVQNFPVTPYQTLVGSVVGSSNSGCLDTATFTLDLQPNPVADFSFGANCSGLTIPFTDEFTWNGTPSAGTAVNYAWDFGDGQNSSAQNPQHTYADGGIYSVTHVVTASTGCADTVTLEVAASELPEASFLFEELCFQNISFYSNSNANGGTLTEYLWNFADGGSGADSALIHEYTTAGTYDVTLTVTNSEGCISTVTLPVLVNPSTPLSSLDVPNIITPNGDMVNDEWTLEPSFDDCYTYEMIIFNRWGNLVFRQVKGGAPFSGLDASGTRLSAGVYFYTISAGELQKNGTLTISY
jgi:gliding motility-associated-like protein